jgi:hypothetical protein
MASDGRCRGMVKGLIISHLKPASEHVIEIESRAPITVRWYGHGIEYTECEAVGRWRLKRPVEL